MQEKKTMCKSSDAGYSLIELIVTVLISSVILMAVMGFLISGLNHFRTVNSEAVLQMESQVTEIFLTELFQESTGYEVISGSDYPTHDNVGNAVDVKQAVRVARDGKVYMLVLVGDELRFGETSAASEAKDQIKTVVSKNRSETFLAQYVQGLTVFPGSFSDAETGTNGWLMVSTNFKVDKKDYLSNSSITLRNIKQN